MIKGRLIFFLLVVLLCQMAKAQRSNLSLFGSGQRMTMPAANKVRSKKVVAPARKSIPRRGGKSVVAVKEEPKDTALYLHLTRRYGFYYGIGRQLTKEEAKWLSCYYRLTEPDTLHRYTVIEAVRGNGNLTADNDMTTYLVGKYDNETSDVDSLWLALLKTVVQLEITPNGTARMPVMESAYNADGDLIYTYIPIKVNDSTVIGHYTDSYGEPVAIRREQNAGNYLQIVMDTAGYERTISYLDDDAYFARNGDGAYMQKKSYDSLGNATLVLSCMMNGKPIRDSWGNCGYAATYDALGNQLSKTYLDDELKPMRLPFLRNGVADVTKRNFVYDNHLRLEREYFTDENGNCQAASDGIQQHLYEYDDVGNILSDVALDSLGRKHGDHYGIAQTLYAYDTGGKLLSTSFRTSNGAYANDADGVCLYKGENRYMTKNGLDILPQYTVEKSGLTTKIYDSKLGQIHVIKVDGHGRQVLSAFYDLSMQPKDVDGLHLQTTTYHKDKALTVQRDSLFSFVDTLYEVTTTDKLTRQRSVKRYRGNELIYTFTQLMDSTMQNVIGQFGSDRYGRPARSHLEDAQYYRVNSGPTYRGAVGYMVGRNEYGEMSYVQEHESRNSNIYCIKLNRADGSAVYLDEDNNEIKDMAACRDSLNKAYCVEVLENKNNGFRSGDIIVKYGDFCYQHVNKDPWKPADDLQIASFVLRNDWKNVLVMRQDPKTGPHIVNLRIPPGTENELGIIIHNIYYTRKEAERYNKCVDSYFASNPEISSTKSLDIEQSDKNGVILLRPFKVHTANVDSWKQGLRGDAFVLGFMSIYEDGRRKYTSMSEGLSSISKAYNNADCDSMRFYFTVDGKTIGNITIPTGYGAMSVSYDYLPDKDIEVLRSLENAYINRERQ